MHYLLILLLVSFAVSAIGWVYFIYFFSLGASCSAWQWIVAAIGYIGIVYVMFSGARRLEIRQAVTYGNDSEFQKYIKKTPILLPFVPIYSLAKYEWLQA